MNSSRWPPSSTASIAAQLISSHEVVVDHVKANTSTSVQPRDFGDRVEIPVSTDLSVDEWLLVDDSGYEPCGLLFGVAVFHIGLIGVLTGNGEVDTLSSALLHARELATGRLQTEAQRVGATGVIGVRLTIDPLDGKSHLARFTAIGTGIRPKAPAARREDRPATAFLSALSGQEFALLLRGDLLPVGLVMGVCVYHVRRLGPLTWLKMYPRSIEMPSYTSALHEARELAMGRLQAEALALRAEGVVGMTTSEFSHVWGSHVIEFFAMGTAVTSIASGQGQLAPTFVLSTRDTVVSDPGAILGDDEGNGDDR